MNHFENSTIVGAIVQQKSASGDPANIECRSIFDIAPANRCAFIEEDPSCAAPEGFISYNYLLFCAFEDQSLLKPVLVCVALLIFCFILLGTASDNFFCPTLDTVSKVLGLSQSVAGVTILAFGNGASDIFAAIAGTTQDRSDLALAGLIGSGMFVSALVLGFIIISNPFRAPSGAFLRDIVFYLVAVFWTFTLFHKKKVELWDGLGFITLYVLYIIMVLGSHYLGRIIPKDRCICCSRKSSFFSATCDRTAAVAFAEDNVKLPLDLEELHENEILSQSFGSSSHSLDSKLNLSQEENKETTPLLKHQCSWKSETEYDFEDSAVYEFLAAISPLNYKTWKDGKLCYQLYVLLRSPIQLLLLLTIPVVDLSKPKNNWCRALNCLHCISTPFLVVIGTHRAFSTLYGTIPLWSVVLVCGSIVAALVCVTSKREEPPFYHQVFSCLGFVASITWIYLIATEVVAIIKVFGLIASVEDTLLAMTIMAWGNGIGDFVLNISMSRQGFPQMAASACFGSPLLTLLLGVGIPFTWQSVGGTIIEVQYNAAVVVLTSFLFICLVSSLFALLIMDFKVHKSYGFYLLCLYFSFCGVAFLHCMRVF